MQHKHLKEFLPEKVKQAFGGENLTVFTDSKALQEKLRELDYYNSALLLMTSGNFSGVNLIELAQQLLNSRV